MNRPEAPTVARLIAAYYAKPGNEAGGNCHVVLDDGNVEDDFVRSALARCEEAGDALGASIMRLFLEMKKTGRHRARGLAWVLQRLQQRCIHPDIAKHLLLDHVEFGKPVIGRCPSCGVERAVATRLLVLHCGEPKNCGPWCVDEAGNWTRPEEDGTCAAVVSGAEQAPSAHLEGR